MQKNYGITNNNQSKERSFPLEYLFPFRTRNNLLYPVGEFSRDVNELETSVLKENDYKDKIIDQIVDNAQAHLKLVYVKPHQPVGANVHLMKRIFDVFFAVAVMILGFPVFALIYLITKFSSAGPAFYSQERLGQYERSFHIYKFRSMYIDAEKFGPQLSREDDPRITGWGRVIRRTRLDELPQFWNVLKGDMSIVGPRPERRHFVNQIIERDPNYKKLHTLKPGVTSMGQVHYGYAENVDEMCARMVYDLKYMRQVNLRTDIFVIAKTVKIMVQCKGK